MQVLAMKNVWRGAMLSGLMLASAPQAWAQAPSLGIIDEDKLAQGYTRYRQALLSLDEQAQAMDARLVAREFLEGEPGKRFDALILKEKRSKAEDTEMDNLVKSGQGKRAEQLGLIGKVDRSAADNQKLENLNGLSQINASRMQTLSDKLFEIYKARQNKVDDENTNKANSVIQQVAGDRKLALVWRKRAVIWNASALDITDEVLKRLNK